MGSQTDIHGVMFDQLENKAKEFTPQIELSTPNQLRQQVQDIQPLFAKISLLDTHN